MCYNFSGETMREGSVLVVSLVVVIFLALTVLLVLAIYAQVTNNYVLQQKKLLVSNVAKSAAYTMAETVKKWFTDGRNDLVQNLAAAPTSLSLPEFRGTVECSVTPISNGYEIRCKARLDKVEDSYSLTLDLLGGLTFPYGIDSDGPVTLGNNVTIAGDILLRRGDLKVGNGALLQGSVYLMGGNSIPIDGGSFFLGQDAVVERDVLAVGNVAGATGGAKATIQGSAMVAGSIDKNITVQGTKTTASVADVRDEISRRLDTNKPPLPVTPPFFPSSAIKLTGTVISETDRTYYTTTVEGGLSVSNVTLTLRIPSTGLLSIAVTNLDLGNHTTINIEGEGIAMIYVRDKLDANQLTINMGEKTRLLIYSNGSENVNDRQEDFYFKNGLSVSSGGLYIYAPEKYVNVENAPDQSTPNINGAIVAKNINMKNSLNLVVPMPLPVEFDPTASGTVYYGLYASYRSWGQ